MTHVVDSVAWFLRAVEQGGASPFLAMAIVFVVGLALAFLRDRRR